MSKALLALLLMFSTLCFCDDIVDTYKLVNNPVNEVVKREAQGIVMSTGYNGYVLDSFYSKLNCDDLFAGFTGKTVKVTIEVIE